MQKKTRKKDKKTNTITMNRQKSQAQQCIIITHSKRVIADRHGFIIATDVSSFNTAGLRTKYI